MATEPRPAPPAATGRDPLFPPMVQRLGAATGIAFVVFVILNIVFQSEETPDWSDPAADYVRYASQNADDVQLGSLFFMLAALSLLWFAAILRGELGRAEAAARGFTRGSYVVLVGGIVTGVGFLLAALTSVVAVSQPEGTPGEIVRALMHLSYASFGLANVGLVLFTLSAGLMIVATRALGRWLGFVALADAVFWFLLLFIVLEPENEDMALGFAWIPAFLLFLVFVLGTSIALIRRFGRTEPAATAPPPAAPTP